MKILLHTCCGPCSVYVVEKIGEDGLTIDGYYYNPNIHPKDEYEKRMKTMQVYSEMVGLKTIYDLAYMQEKWELYERNIEERCIMCYKTRLEKIVLYARDNGYDYFTTTLLVSPYQKHEYIKELCFELGERNNVNFYYYDFREGFRYGQKKAKEMGLYRQKYCGCIMSLSQK